jgi:preprotein translocase subunit SecE
MSERTRSMRMNTKAEQPKGVNAADIGKLVLAGLVLAAGIFAYSWYSNDSAVPASVRLLGMLVALGVALAIGAFTGPGRRVRSFITESQFEMRKVVWPTRDETLKTTGIILVVVVILSLLLGLIDLILKSVVLDWLLKLGS